MWRQNVMALTNDQVASYARYGFLTGLRVLDEAGADEVRRRFDRLEALVGQEKAQIGLVDRHFEESFIMELATRPAVLDAVESLIGPDILLLATHFFCKYGQDEKFVAWHQDLTYWALDPPRAITAWYAIDDADCENGCMKVLPGTHLDGIRDHGKATASGNLLSINQEASVRLE